MEQIPNRPTGETFDKQYEEMKKVLQTIQSTPLGQTQRELEHLKTLTAAMNAIAERDTKWMTELPPETQIANATILQIHSQTYLVRRCRDFIASYEQAISEINRLLDPVNNPHHRP